MSAWDSLQWKRTALALVLLITIVPTHEVKERRKRAMDCAAKYQRIPSHTACARKSDYVIKSGLEDDEKKTILDYHNTLRERVDPTASNMMKLRWDDEVAMLAQKWADTCSTDHDANHQRYIPGRFSTGQNLAFGYKSWTLAMDAWYNEYKDFTYGVMSSNVQTKVGHYTQMVWAEVTLLGCGYAQCQKPGESVQNLHFCNYGPGGNVGDWSKPYKRGPSASECPNHKSGKLCDCPTCENDATHDLATCKCQCSQKFHTGPKCSMNCSLAERLEPTYCKTQFAVRDAQPCFKYSNVPSTCPYMCKVCPLPADPGIKATTTPDDGGHGDVSAYANVALTLISLLIARHL